MGSWRVTKETAINEKRHLSLRPGLALGPLCLCATFTPRRSRSHSHYRLGNRGGGLVSRNGLSDWEEDTIVSDWVASRGDQGSKSQSSRVPTGLRLSSLALVWLALLIVIKVFLVPFAFSHYGEWLTSVEASHCYRMANLLGMEAALDQDVVATPYFAIRVTPSCTGVDYLLYMMGLVALFPMRNHWRPLWVLVLPLCLYLLLISRLTFLLFIGRYYPTWISTLHDTWNLGLILFFVAVWFGFVAFQIRSTPRRTPPEPVE